MRTIEKERKKGGQTTTSGGDRKASYRESCVNAEKITLLSRIKERIAVIVREYRGERHVYKDRTDREKKGRGGADISMVVLYSSRVGIVEL